MFEYKITKVLSILKHKKIKFKISYKWIIGYFVNIELISYIMKKRTNVTSKNPIIIDLINLFSRLKLRVGFFRFVVELLILCRSPILLNNNV